MILRLSLLFFLFSLLTESVLAKIEDDQPSRKALRRERKAYIAVSAGSGYGHFLDFGTSPLIYSGLTLNTGFGILKQSSIKESAFRAQFISGRFGNKASENLHKSGINSLGLQHSVLYKSGKYSGQKTSYLLGYMFDVTGTYRINNALMNASQGFDMFGTAFLSGKIKRNFQRKDSVTKKLLGFIKYKRKPRLRTLSYQLNIPLVNSVFRNDFAYLSEGIYQENPVFVNYSFRIFNGFSIGSRLDYEWYLTNNNRLAISYIWDAYRTGKKFEHFQLSQHIFQFSLIFNLK